ncbi:MAG: hypothetical protein IPK04_05900 [Bdellovibrionales bacterium]|nr:hypothetical protein [Bdellovibrionales bacterium]
MKTAFFFLNMALAITLTTACSKSDPLGTVDIVNNPENPLEGAWPEYLDQPLAGKISGVDWAATVATIRPVSNKPEESFLDIYAEPVNDPCVPQFNLKRPMATMIVPSDYQVTEYIADTTKATDSIKGNPITFVEYGSETKNTVAEKTKMKITSISKTGFEMKMYASSVDVSGIRSEINGTMPVLDCKKKVDFKIWSNLAGTYRLASFDGKTLTKSWISNLEMDKKSLFFDRPSGNYLKALVFPLYYVVSDARTETFDFGPMDGLGTTQVSEANGVRKIKYEYSGPLTYDKLDITVKIMISVTQTSSQLEVDYTLEVPVHIVRTSHKFVLTK